MQFLLSLSLLISPTLAGDFFVEVGPDQVPSGPDVGGLNWVRVFNNFDDGGWWLAHHWETGGTPGYNVAPLTEGLAIDISARIRLAEWENTKDHGIERCPDGSFLHVYSLNITNDSARAARYTDDWTMTAHGWVEEDATARAHNDMPVICSEHLQGAAFTNHSDLRPTFFEIGPDATVIATHEMDIPPHVSGSSFKYDPISDRYLMIANAEPGLSIHWINRDLTTDISFNIEPIPSLFRHYWPQGLMRVGDYWLVVFLGEAYHGQYLAGDGDVYIAVLNDDFSTLETIKVSDNIDGDLGSARPSFARHSDQLLVGWDKGFLPYVSLVTLDLVQFGVDEDDSGFVPPDGDEDTPCADTADEDDATTGTDEPGSSGGASELAGDTSDDWDEPRTGEGIKDDRCDKGCGCSNSPISPRFGWGLLVALLAVTQRRR